MTVESVSRQLQRALTHLAWKAEKQIDYISRLAVGPDELALEFDDAFRVASGMVSEGILPETFRDLLVPMDELLTEMTHGTQDEWSVDSLTHSSAWNCLRRLATDALNHLDFEDKSGSE